MACSWAPDSSKIATAGADGVVAICTLLRSCLADCRGRFHLRVHPDIQRWIRRAISTERNRLCQRQYHRLRLTLWCLERVRYSRIIQLEMENPSRAYQSHHRFYAVRIDVLRRFVRRNHEELLHGIWG